MIEGPRALLAQQEEPGSPKTQVRGSSPLQGIKYEDYQS